MKLNNFLDMIKDTESNQLSLDFDGVIHDSYQGFHDGTIYGDPLPGALDAVKHLSEILKYDLTIFTCKANPERPLIDGKTGVELIWDWLKKYDIDKYIKDIVYTKPNAVAYVDDKGIRFENWDDTLKQLER